MSAPELSYRVHGGNGPALLLVHGFLSSSRQWQPNLEALQAVSQPITVDLWGHGESPTPEEPHWYSATSYVQQLEGLRNRLGIQQWALGGYSLGAGITLAYAHHHPQRTLCQFFTNSSSALASASLQQQWLDTAADSAEKILREGRRAIRRLPVHPRFARRLDEPIRQILLEDSEKLHPIGVANTLQHTTPHVSVRNFASDNQVPTLLCFGRHESRFEPSKRWAEAHMNHLTISELEAGHAVNLEDVEGFNAAVTRFLQAHFEAAGF